jgi:hypothetical protein
LEAILAKEQGTERPDYLDEGLERSEAALERLHGLLGAGEVFGQVVALVKHNFGSLRWCASRGCTRQALCIPDFLRWPACLFIFLERTPAELRPDVVEELGWRSGKDPLHVDCILGHWLTDLSQKRCRLPPDLAPETMARLITVYRQEKPNYVMDVCNQCGLRLPVCYPTKAGDYTIRTSFPSCPHCGGREFFPSNRTPERAFPWKELLDAELAEVGGRGS